MSPIDEWYHPPDLWPLPAGAPSRAPSPHSPSRADRYHYRGADEYLCLEIALTRPVPLWPLVTPLLPGNALLGKRPLCDNLDQLAPNTSSPCVGPVRLLYTQRYFTVYIQYTTTTSLPYLPILYGIMTGTYARNSAQNARFFNVIIWSCHYL